MEYMLSLTNLTPSQMEVLRIIKDAHKPKSSSEIIKESPYSQRAVRYALKTLLQIGIIEKHSFLPDMRQSRYKLKLEIERNHAKLLSDFDRIITR